MCGVLFGLFVSALVYRYTRTATCSAGVFRVVTNKALPSRFAAMLVYKMWA